ncbi:hypothetical protein V6N13_019884 [Hibiscus sabdariffa]
MLRAFPNITDSPIAPLSSIGVDGSRPDADPPDPGRVVDLSIDVMSEMDVSDPVQTNKQPLAASRSPPSYKDTLMASTSHSPVTTDIFDDDEVVLLEGDDICPASTSLSDALQQLAPIEPVVPSMTESFGPWMMVKRRQCRTYRKDSSHQPGFVPPVVQESRFNPIFEEEPPVAPILPPATSTTVISLPASVPIEPVDSVTFDALSEEVVPSTHKGLIQAAATTKGKEPLPAVGPSSKPSSLSNRSGSTLSSACFALFPRLPLKFNRSKHTAIVISENANPNVPRDASIPIIFPPSEPPGGVQNVHVLSKSNAIVSSAEGVTSHAHATSVTIDSSVVGCGHLKFLTALKQYLRDYKPDIIGIVEPRTSRSHADSVIGAFGFPFSHRIEAAGFSGGLWLYWRDTIVVDILLQHFQFMHCRLTCKKTCSSSLVTLVYASPSASRCKIIWPHLRDLASTINGPWMLMGDFNATVDVLEWKGGAGSTRPSRDFQSFIFYCGLRDLGYQGPDYTWSRGSTHARLDRMLCNH